MACLLLTACRSADSTPATCESCHPSETREWEGSRHRHAFDNQAFQASFAIEHSSFCSDCHQSVGCTGCHVGGHQRNQVASASVSCTRCHEFAFPGAVAREDGDMMQTTIREHASSKSAAMACTGCHRSHAIAEVRDPEWLAAHLDVKAEIRGDRARLTLTQTAPGHAFPTGDLFRRLEVGVELHDAAGNVVRREVKHLARHWENGHGPAGRVLVADDRVFDAPSEVDLGYVPVGVSVAWWVKIQRVAQVGSGVDPASATIESEVPLHSGVMP
jgi:hypothetical protein